MSSNANTNPVPGHRRAKSHDVRSTTTAFDGHPRPSFAGSVSPTPRLFGLGLGFGSGASEPGDPAPAQAAPGTSAPTTEDNAGEGVIPALPAVRMMGSNPLPDMATGAPLPPIQKGVTGPDPASEEVAAATPRLPVSQVAPQGPGGAAVRTPPNIAGQMSSGFFESLTRPVRRGQDRAARPTVAPLQLLPGFVSPRRRRDAAIQTGASTGLNSNIGPRPVTPVHQVIPSYDQRRAVEDAWLRREELHRQEWEARLRLEQDAANFHAGVPRRQPFRVAGRRAPIAPAAVAGPAFLGRPRGASHVSAIEQASAFGNVVPGPSHRARFVSVPAGGPGAVDLQAHVRRPRADIGSYVDSPGHGPFLGASRVESQGAHAEHPSPSTPEGMTREMYEMMCEFSEDVRQEQEEAEGDEEEDDERGASAAGAAAASLRLPMPGLNQHGHLELPRGLSRAEFEAEQAQLQASLEAFSELVNAEEEVTAADEAEDRCRDANRHRQPRVDSPGASASSHHGVGTLYAETWQQAEDELWDVLNRRNVPSYGARGELVWPTSPSAAEIARERAAIAQRARRRAEEAYGESERGAGRGTQVGDGLLDPNPQIPFGMPDDLYDLDYSGRVRQMAAQRERVEGLAGPSHPSPLPAPLACLPGQIQLGVTEGGLIEAWRRNVAQHPAESHDPPAEASRRSQQQDATPPVHFRDDPFDDRSVAAIPRGSAARSRYVGRSGRSSTRTAARGSYNPGEVSTGSPRPRGRGVVVREHFAPPEQTPLPGPRRAMRTPSPSVYSRTSGFGTSHAADQRPVIGGVSGPDGDDIFGSPSAMLAPVFSGNQRRNPSSIFEGVNSGSDPVDEESSGEGHQEGVKGKMVVRNGSAARASPSSLSGGGNHSPRWVYESPSVGKMDSGPPRDKGKGKATSEEVDAQVAEEMLPQGASASPVASVERPGTPRAPSPSVSLSSTLLGDSGSRDGEGASSPPPPPPPSSAVASSTAVPQLAGEHRTLDLDEGFAFDAGILPPPMTTRRKVAGGLRGLARGLKDKLKPSSRKAAARPPPEPTAAAAPRPESVERSANQSTASGLSGGGRPRLFASLAGRRLPRSGSSVSVHRPSTAQAGGGSGSLGSRRRWPARGSSLLRAFSIPNLRSPSMTAETLNKPLPQPPLFVVKETTSSDEASDDADPRPSAESVRLPAPAGQSLTRGHNVSFAGTPSATSWLRSEGSVAETVPGEAAEPSPVRAPQQQQRIAELEEALHDAESSRAAAEARASAAEENLARALAELDVYVAEATAHQRALTAQRVDFQVQLDQLTRERDGAAERHAAAIRQQHGRHLDYVRALAGSQAAERQGMEAQIAMLYSAVGGLQTQLLFAGALRPGGGAGARQSLQFTAPEAQQNGTAANEPAQQQQQRPPSPEFVPGPRLRYGSRLPQPGLFQILPHPIPLPPHQPPFAPSESVRQANRAGRLAAEAGGPEYRQPIPRRLDPDSD
ncbi:hypothetical protein VE03_02395 [Pseudogymnoascus sp. 23342-1-I1]|nr:hypothetical protein VE03_02395 [Pseudogymnoascus sp. 23342-1-I1]